MSLKVFLLGAYKLNTSSKWVYEQLDGDRKTDGRTTGDVAFHLAAGFDGKKTYVLYDSVLVINQKKEATSGAIRLATRTDIDPTKWAYRTLEESSDSLAMTGYDVALSVTTKGLCNVVGGIINYDSKAKSNSYSSNCNKFERQEL